MISYESEEALEQVAHRICELPIPGSIQFAGAC